MVQHQNFFKDSWLNMRKWGEGALLNELHQQKLLQFQKQKIGWNRILHSLMTETRICINCLISRKREIKRWLPGILKCKNGLRNWMKTHMGRQVWGKDWAWDGWMAPKWGSGGHLSCTQLLQTTGVPLSALHSDSFCLVILSVGNTQLLKCLSKSSAL